MHAMELSLLNIRKKLKTVYVDSDVEVVLAPNEKELEEIILWILKEKRVATVREIHSYLEAIASEEKIRRVLHRLVVAGAVKQYHDGRYEILGEVKVA